MHMVHAATEVGAWSREEREAKICGTPCAPDGRGAVVLAFANESGDANIAAGCVCGVCVSKTHQSATLCARCCGRAGAWAGPASGAPARAPAPPPRPLAARRRRAREPWTTTHGQGVPQIAYCTMHVTRPAPPPRVYNFTLPSKVQCDTRYFGICALLPLTLFASCHLPCSHHARDARFSKLVTRQTSSSTDRGTERPLILAPKSPCACA